MVYINNQSNILDEVQKVLKQRSESHGNAKQNFSTIARLWTDYLDHNISSKDVALMMMLLKIARVKDGEPNEDDFIDMIGYAKLGSEL